MCIRDREIGYDRENVDKGGYRGLTQTDRYGRIIPKAAHGTVRFDAPTNLGSTKMCIRDRKWTLNLSAFVLALPMLYIFGCGLYTLYCREWMQFLILLVAEFGCFALIFMGTLIADVYKRQQEVSRIIVVWAG